MVLQESLNERFIYNEIIKIIKELKTLSCILHTTLLSLKIYPVKNIFLTSSISHKYYNIVFIQSK